MDEKDKIEPHSSKYTLPPPPVPVVPIADDAGLFFPVHRIYCVARNYTEHAREMGADPDQEPPFFFTKPPDSIVPCAAAVEHDDENNNNNISTVTIPYPLDTSDLHYEIELVVALKRGGSRIAVEEAASCVFGLAVGVDLTRRDLQSVAKTKGRPWCAAKGFDRSAPIGNLVPIKGLGSTTTTTMLPQYQDATLWLDVNGERRQTGQPMAQMIWDVPHIISILSESFELQPGDLIFTGTPAGVGPIQKGDRITGGMDGLGEIAFTVI